MGKEYKVIDGSRAHWWRVRNEKGVHGFVPANYLRDKANDGIETERLVKIKTCVLQRGVSSLSRS